MERGAQTHCARIISELNRLVPTGAWVVPGMRIV